MNPVVNARPFCLKDFYIGSVLGLSAWQPVAVVVIVMTTATEMSERWLGSEAHVNAIISILRRLIPFSLYIPSVSLDFILIIFCFNFYEMDTSKIFNRKQNI